MPPLPQLILGAALTALTASHSANAQEWTVTDAVAAARAHQARLAAAGGHRLTAEGIARQNAAFANPTFEYQAENLDSPLQHDVYRDVSVPLDLTGKRLALRGATRAAAHRAIADSTTTARDVEVVAAQAYWRAALTRALAVIAGRQQETLSRIAAFDSARLREGGIAEVVAIRTHLAADRARLAAATSRADAERARAALATAVGLPPDSIPDVAPFLATDSAALAVLDSLPEPPPIDAATGVALTHRPELAALHAAVREAKDRRQAAGRGILSDVTIVAGSKYTFGYNTRVLGGVIPIPLFDQNNGNREAAAGDLVTAEANLREGEVRVRAEVQAAIDAYAELRNAARATPRSLAARTNEVAAITEATYREGGASVYDLLAVQRSQIEDLTAALQFAVDARLARIELNHALGLPALSLEVLP